MKKKVLILIVILLLAVPIFAGCGTSQPSSNGNSSNTSETNSDRQKAPDFSWQTQDGKVMHLSDLKGKAVLLDFWATWCGPCRMTIPHVESLYNKYKNKGVVVIGVNLDKASSRNAVSEFTKKEGITYLVISDASGTVASQYGATSIPRFFFVDKHGNIAKMIVGYDPNMEETFSKEIDSLLAEK
jgi:cytochrome c biogenesis protein CcmG/thiol:disulfide interchange protein DsbE